MAREEQLVCSWKWSQLSSVWSHPYSLEEWDKEERGTRNPLTCKRTPISLSFESFESFEFGSDPLFYQRDWQLRYIHAFGSAGRSAGRRSLQSLAVDFPSARGWLLACPTVICSHLVGNFRIHVLPVCWHGDGLIFTDVTSNSKRQSRVSEADYN